MRHFISCSIPNKKKAGNISPKIARMKGSNFMEFKANEPLPSNPSKVIGIKINATKAKSSNPKNLATLQHIRKNRSFLLMKVFILISLN